jgi:hypothetical protein
MGSAPNTKFLNQAKIVIELIKFTFKFFVGKLSDLRPDSPYWDLERKNVNAQKFFFSSFSRNVK